MTRWTPTGDPMQVSGSMLDARRGKMDRAYSYAVKSQTHMWIATAVYQIPDQRLTDSLDGMLLDTESLLEVQTGCYVCEEPFRRELVRRRCPGEPKTSIKSP